MKTRSLSVLGALLVTSALMGTPAAAAEVSPHCQQTGFCLFAKTRFTGTKAPVSSPGECRRTAELGIPVVRSAARGFGDGAVLALYSDSDCGTSAGFVHHELADVSARSFRLLPLPSR